MCEMCGAEGNLYKTKIEGTNLNVCETCSKYGTVLTPMKKPEEVRARPRFVKRREPEETKKVTYMVSNDFAEKIRTRLPEDVKLHSLKLHETATSFAEWFAEDNE